MVRMPSHKDVLREIKKTASRFVSIVLLLILSVAFFSGLRATRPDMYQTADAYMDAHDMYDIRVISTLGLKEDDLAAVRGVGGVSAAYGFYRFDAVAATGQQDLVVTATTLGKSGMNSPEVLSGSLPSQPDECAVEAHFLSQSGLVLGDTFSFKEVQEGFEDGLRGMTFKIVGVVRSPLYIAKVQRGSSTLGSGSVAAFIMLPAGAVTLDYYTEADITVSGAKSEIAYTEAYKGTVQAVKDRLEAIGPAQAKRRHDALVDKATGELQDARAELSARQAELDDSKRKLSDARTELADGGQKLDAEKAQAADALKKARDELDASSREIRAGLDALEAAQEQLDAQKAAWAALPDAVRQAQPDTARQLSDAQQKLDANRASLVTAQRQLNAGQRDYETTRADTDKKFADAEASLKDAEAEIADGEAKVLEGEDKLAQGRRDLEDAEKKIADIPEGKWFIEDRSANIGYSGYGDDADRMGALGGVFPIIFFAVAGLVALTTMTRMVDEKRGEIGTYKALGHSRMTTAGKFIYYSLASAVIGVAGGLAIGMTFFPNFIFQAYSVLYDLPPLITPFYGDLIFVSASAALVTTVGAAVFASFRTLGETPAGLLRPKAPEPGKRVLLEYITPLWKRLSFFGKVSLRNIFRYKKRLIMTLLGIAGCTALIVTGFGLRDSITDITDLQFGRIFKYNLLVYLSDKAEETATEEALKESADVSGWLFTQSTAADFVTAAGTVNGHVLVPDAPDRLGGFIRLAHRSDGKAAALPDDGAVITEKMAELLHLRTGDTFTVDAGGKYAVRVSDITENYVNHAVYMTPAYYKTVFGKDHMANQVLVTLKSDTDEAAGRVSSELLKVGDVGYVSHFAAAARSFRDSMNSVNAVVVIILISAALLALVVLYNLTNINITERMRELATIKVLGFYDREVSWYIFRENTILTAAGVVLGLVGGKFLHSWLVRTVELNFVMFGRSAKPASYAFAAALTFLFAALVNGLGQRRMKRVDMIQSLKTNE